MSFSANMLNHYKGAAFIRQVVLTDSRMVWMCWKRGQTIQLHVRVVDHAVNKAVCMSRSGGVPRRRYREMCFSCRLYSGMPGHEISKSGVLPPGTKAAGYGPNKIQEVRPVRYIGKLMQWDYEYCLRNECNWENRWSQWYHQELILESLSMIVSTCFWL
jgi:hypothetical protein